MLAIRPGTDEYGAFYAGYIARIADGQWLTRLEAQPSEYRDVLSGVNAERAIAPTAPGKWSIAQALSHVSDTERVFGFRMLWFARGEAAGLPGFDQDAWVAAVAPHGRTLQALLDEFASVRAATLALLRSIPDAAADRRGTANGNPMTVRACAWMIAGHAQHHLEGFRQVKFGS